MSSCVSDRDFDLWLSGSSSPSRFRGGPRLSCKEAHLERGVSRAFKAMATLEHDVSALISSGTVTFSANLTGIGDDKPVSRGVEI